MIFRKLNWTEALNVILKISLDQFFERIILNEEVLCHKQRFIIIINLLNIIVMIINVRSDGVFMSRLVDRGRRPNRQEIILNCVLQIPKYKVGEHLLKKYFLVSKISYFSAKRCLVKTLSDKDDEFNLSLKV